jgi:DNA-binding transcriptional regulator LsrR (DeoR family)
MTESKIRTQQLRVYELLSAPNPDGLTRMQIALCLGIERASVCRRVAELRDKGKLWVVKKGIDPTTRERAEFLTASQDVAEKANAKKVAPVERELTGKLF